jgi:hypothetical protein
VFGHVAHNSRRRTAAILLALAFALWTPMLYGQTKTAPKPEELDKLLAPIALYPDQLLAQILLSATTPGDVVALNGWLATTTTLKGSDLQDAAAKAGFEPSCVALVLFPQTVKMMAGQVDWLTGVGRAFTANRSLVFESIQRLRKQAQQAGHLKTTPQQEVETRTTSTGQQVIVIEPSNPQVVYVPQYNPTVVYTQPSTTTVVVERESSSSADAAAAGVIGFAAGIALGAAIDNDYYYGPYGWHGGPAYMYNDAWDDWYDHREDAREDWMDHREDVVEERGDRARDTQEQRTERQQSRQENRPETQQQREQRRADAQSASTQARTQSGSTQARTQGAATPARSANQETRGYGSTTPRTAPAERSGTRSDAFSGYSNGRSERAASSRGQRSRSSSSSRRSSGGRRR